MIVDEFKAFHVGANSLRNLRSPSFSCRLMVKVLTFGSMVARVSPLRLEETPR